MKHWQTKPLGHVLEVSRERIQPLEYPTSSFNYVGLESVEGHTGKLLPYQPTAGAEIKSTKNVFHPGQILFGKLRPYLNKIYLAREKGICSTDIYVLNPRQHQMDAAFAAYFLRSPVVLGAVSNAMAGANLPRINEESLLAIPAPIPPLAEQERIVRLLDEADELRKLRAQADRRTADLIPSLFHEMFGDPDDNQRGWACCQVSSFVEELHGGRSVNPAGADEAAGRFRVLKISAVTWGEFNPEESKPVPAMYEPPESHFVRAGDLLFSRANTTELVAATSYVFDTPPNLLLPDKLWRFVWKQPQAVEPLFVWWLFQAPSVRRELGQRATGTGGSMKNISKPKVMSVEVPLPPLPLQKKFAARVSEIRAMQAEQAASRRRLEHLFQSLLHRAFQGEL